MNTSTALGTGRVASVPDVGESRQRRGDPLRRAKWNFSVAEDLVEPAKLDLLPVFGTDGAVTDFAWRLANSNSARILGCSFYGVFSFGLADVFLEEARRGVLFRTYACAFSSQSLQIVYVSEGERHVVWPSGSGLTVSVTGANALARIAGALGDQQA